MKGRTIAAWCVSLALLALVAGTFVDRKGGAPPASLRVGVPGGLAGMLLARALESRPDGGARVTRAPLGVFSIKDCCASVTRFALSAEELDAALLCPDAAEDLASRDPRFTRLGPCVLNGDVAVVRHGAPVSLLGVPRGRERLDALARNRFGMVCEMRTMIPASLPYAYARRMVDGVVVDALGAFDMEGDRVPLAGPDADAVTWELIARKDVMRGEAFLDFMEGLDRAVRDLEREETLAHELERHRGKPWTRREVEEWKGLRVRFVRPPVGSSGGFAGGFGANGS